MLDSALVFIRIYYNSIYLIKLFSYNFYIGPDGELPIDAPVEVIPIEPVQAIDKSEIPEDSPLYEPPTDEDK
jgi:hypothetical protein